MSDVIQLGMSADGSELTAVLTEEREELQETESAFERFGNGCVAAMSFAGRATIAVVREISGEIHAFAKGALGTFGSEVGTYAGKMLLYGSAATATTGAFTTLWRAFRIGLNVAKWFVPWLGTASLALTVATAATWGYRAANEQLSGGLTKSIVSIAQTSKALGDLKDAGSELGSSLKSIGGDMLSIGAAAIGLGADFFFVGEAFNAIDELAGSALGAIADQLRLTGQGFRIMADSALDWVDAGNQSAESLRNNTAATEALIAKQQAQMGMFAQLRDMQTAAVAQAQQSAELQRIGSLTTAAAVDAEIVALQQKTAAAIAAGDATEESQRRAAALFAALEGQRFKIQADDNAAKLKAEVTAQEAINAAKKEQAKLNESAADQVARLKDQIDLASGAATRGEIAMREMLRAGHSQEAADEVRKLTDDLDKIQEAERDGKKNGAGKVAKADRTELKAAAFGSQEAASIMLRGVGGIDSDGKAIAKESLTVQKQQLVALKAIKPPVLTPINLGVA